MPRTRFKLFPVDILGCSILAICLSAAVWFVSFRDSGTTTEVTDLERGINIDRAELSALRTERDRERAQLADREKRLSETGALPSQAPVEQYLQTLSALAKQYRLDVLRQSPLPAREYPGLLERRYTYEVSGSLSDIAQFLVSIERSEFWADIGFLKIVGQNVGNKAAEPRIASLTICFFSAPSASPDTGQG